MANGSKLTPVQWAALGFGSAAVAGIIWAAIACGADVVRDEQQLYRFIKLSIAIAVLAISLTAAFYLVSETSRTDGIQSRWESFWQAIKFRPVATLIVLLLGIVAVVSVWSNGYEGILNQFDEWLSQPGE